MVIKFTPKFYRIGSLHLRGAGSTLKFLFLIEWSILVLVCESVSVGKCLPCHFLYWKNESIRAKNEPISVVKVLKVSECMPGQMSALANVRLSEYPPRRMYA
jgi:hypothetical protein